MIKKLLLLLFICLMPDLLFSEPYLAVREGLKCGICHINRTGGGQRTRHGSGFGTQALPWKKFDLKARNVPHYWSFLEDRLAVGGDFRVSNDSTFVEDNTANTFRTDKSNLYLYGDFLPGIISFYLDETVAPGGAQSREIFGMFSKLPAYGWIKGGKFVLPYGIRLEDDRAFIREVTGFNFNTPDIGFELGFEPGNWHFVGSLTNGTAGALDNNTSKQLVGTAAYIHDRFRIGISGSRNTVESQERGSAAAWLGFRLGKAVFLGEVDFVKDDLTEFPSREQLITYSEVNYEVIDGWNFKVAYEFFDPSRDIDENERDRVVIGVEPFLAPFIHLQLFYRFNQSIPQNALQNADELNFRVHIYF